MAEEKVENTLLEHFKDIIATDETLRIREFLNDQNISDVAELINELPAFAISSSK